MDSIESVLHDTLDYSHSQNYIGWDKHDGMSSRLRKKLPFETKWTNLVFHETIKRAPINLYPSKSGSITLQNGYFPWLLTCNYGNIPFQDSGLFPSVPDS